MKRYLTTPIYYANGAPHLGHAYTTLVADCYRRFYRLQGDDVLLISGTDEHGQKIERAAAASGIDIERFVFERSEGFQRLWAALDIEIDRFERTTDEHHKEVARAFWQRLVDNGDVYPGRYEGLYCVECEQYFTAGEFCEVHRRPLERFSEPTWFFRLSAYKERLIDHIEAHPKFILPVARRNEVLAVLKSDALNDLSISRTSTCWGVPVPGDSEHVMYVWIDALVSYLSALGDLDSERLGEYWADTIHFIGKDILIFHCVYWPAFLLSARLPLPKSIIANGWLTVEGRKISKSDPETIIDPGALANTIGSDGLRYYLLRSVTLGNDVDFSREQVIRVLNTDLANNLGNLVSRFVRLLATRYPEGFECDVDSLTGDALVLVKETRRCADEIREAIDGGDPARAVRCFIRTCSVINAWIQQHELWALPDGEELRRGLWIVYQAIADLTIPGWCLVPGTTEKIRDALVLGPPSWRQIGVRHRHVRAVSIP
ncbi:MAG: methionine--tRNA ligase, partial [Pseudomonadales bacterium]|nr:methionine--tRNA ligase [Pseudomonadales bacterium]